MITNERQYRITKAQADKFEQALAQLQAQREETHIHPLLQQAEQDALQSQLDDLHDELEEYDTLKTGEFLAPEIEKISEIPTCLIRARVASGMTQRELAEQLGLKEQQIQRYEANEYASASFARVNKIADVLTQVLKAQS